MYKFETTWETFIVNYSVINDIYSWMGFTLSNTIQKVKKQES